MNRITYLLPLVLLVLAGCSYLESLQTSPPPLETETTTPTPLSPGQTSTPLISTPTPGEVTLLIWLPPTFDPQAGTPAGDILQARLDEFETLYPRLKVEIRVKAESGPGGLLDSLSSTSAAAPLALPDLVALPLEGLQGAALKGLLHPYDDLSDLITDPDWYPYAVELAQLQNSTFGIPFAGDILQLLYRPDLVEGPPLDWENALSLTSPFAFPAADQQALFTLIQYQATGAPILNEEGRPTLDQNALNQVLNFYQQARETGLFPIWLTQFQDDMQSWEAFQENRADMVVTWSSRYLTEGLENTTTSQILTPDGDPFTLASGWVWTLANSDQTRQELTIELVEHLSAPDFLAEWTAALGYLPPRPSALDMWNDSDLKSKLDLISRSASIIPTSDILSSLGPPLQKATVDVLKQQSDPTTAAQDAVNSLAEP